MSGSDHHTGHDQPAGPHADGASGLHGSAGDPPAAFDQLCERLGLIWEYVDGCGKPTVSSVDTRLRAVQALGVDITRPDDAADALEWVDQLRGPEPVIAWGGRIPDGLFDRADWQIRLEDGQMRGPSGTGGRDPLPFGIHRLDADGQPTTGEPNDLGVTVVAAPRRNPNAPLLGPHRPWGAVMSLDSLWSSDGERANLDLLATMARWLHHGGGDVMALLPLNLELPGETSPYRPSTRRWWRSDLSAGPLTARQRRNLASWRAANPSIERLAWFVMAQRQFGTEWSKWPPEILQAGDTAEGRARYWFSSGGDMGGVRDSGGDTELDAIVLAQFQAEHGMASFSSRLGEASQCLLLDLPIGSHPDGFDCWEYRDQFAFDASLGAPPDDFNPNGQSWGIPPMNPFKARGDQHQLLRQCLDHQLAHAHLLRIDHFFGIERQFWTFGDASDGVYVRWPRDEILAMLELAAWRKHASLIGENLGTAPSDFDSLMERYRIHPMHVGRFAPFVDPKPESVASLGTHDLATFAGWWQGHGAQSAAHRERDAELRRRLRAASGLRPSDAARPTRHLDAAIPDVDASAASVPLNAAETAADGEPLPEMVLRTELERLAVSDAALVLVSLEELTGDVDPINTPGTISEQNWTRPANASVEDITSDEHILGLLHFVERCRRAAQDRNSHPNPGWFGAIDQHLLAEGTHRRLGAIFGAKPTEHLNRRGAQFTTVCPGVDEITVVGDFNGWNPVAAPLHRLPGTDVWTAFVSGARAGQFYKYVVRGGGTERLVADPCCSWRQAGIDGASVVWPLHFEWRDSVWIDSGRTDLGVDQHGRSVYLAGLDDPSNAEFTARDIVCDARADGVTTLALVPPSPEEGQSLFTIAGERWTPQQVMYLIDCAHRSGIAVLIWYPADELAGLLPVVDELTMQSLIVSGALHRYAAYHVDGLLVPSIAPASPLSDSLTEAANVASTLFPGTAVISRHPHDFSTL